MRTVNDFAGKTDNDRIDEAIRNRNGDIVVIPPRVSDIEPERNWWLLDRAILLPENTTILLQNCRIKLSDKCRDNFFRSANCGLGIENPEMIGNIHIRGIGDCVLEGADHPRSTGDSSKFLACPCPKNFSGSPNPTFNDLHRHSYGTDAGKEGESGNGDWRNIGILMANVHHLSIENIRIVEQHAWAISLENCSFANINHIEFTACMTRVIDGEEHNVENQDGVNLRNGCHDVIISDITGTTGDDVVALTCISSQFRVRKDGEMHSTQVLGNDYTKREKGIYNVIVRNILASPAGGCCMLRLLPTDGAEIRNVVIDGLVDTSPADFHSWCSVLVGEQIGLVGEPGYPYGTVSEECLFDISISNIISNARSAVFIPGGLLNSSISNVSNRYAKGKTLDCRAPQLMKGVLTTNIHERN
ncbi:MAG: hypothetical protein IKZ46_05955 [Victivallales bacterium]|nr:hypothetical protein [Victivallales bacterium]